MAGTTIASLLTQVRNQLVERTARFWSDDELKAIMRLGAVDLWGAILDLHQDHYLKIDENAVLRAGTLQISGVPADCFRVQAIEPFDLGADVVVTFTPRKWKSPEFTSARSLAAQDRGWSRAIYYQLSGVGAPTGVPTILTAPKLTADLRVRIAYNPTLTWDGDVNPVPGESDNALKAWTIAYARAKETEDRLPEAGWLAVYATEKANLLTRLTPRQEQEPDVVEDFFQGRDEAY